MSRSMSWLIVAKMPLLISSRMMSATLTVRRSASSLTVMVAGSSIAPRSRGSIVWTCDRKPPSRRGGLRGPASAAGAAPTPGHGLLLRWCRGSCGPEVDAREERRRDLGLERPTEGALGVGDGQTGCRPADVRAAAGQPAGLVSDDRAIRGPDDADELALGPARPAGDARARRCRPGRSRRGGRRRRATTPPPRWRARPTPLRRRPSWWCASAWPARPRPRRRRPCRWRHRRRLPRRRPSW